MNERERERSATIYYDAQEKFGTPVNEEGVDEVYVSQQRRTYSFQRRDAPATGVSSVIQSMRRLPNSAAPVTMPPSQPDYDYPSPSKGHSAALARLSASPSSQHRQKPIVDYEDFVPGNNRGKPSSSSLAAFKRQNSGEVMELSYSRRGAASGDLPPPHPSHGGAYQQHHPPRPKDFPVVVGSYGNDREKADISFTRRNSGEQRRRDEESYLRYGSPPQLNVNQHQNPQGPQFYHGFRETKANSQGQRFGSSGSASRHLYEEVPTSAPYESSARETDILGDDDLGHGHQHVPVLFKPQQNPNRSRLEPEEVDSDGHSGVYQPGKYQPSEDAGSSSEDDDPEYLELMERDNIITRYEKGPDSQDVDPWENPQFDVYAKTDRFGFIHKSSDKASEEERKHQRRVFKELSREKKWLKMIEDWKSGKPSKKMEDRVWKGIPEKLRLVVWPRLLGAERMREEKKDVYMNLLLRARLVSKDIKQIDLDINRTYRDHLAFRKRYDVKQKSLLNVLAAYSMYNTEVGYCQGMSQIVALFLMYLDEEDAFWCLHALMVSPRHTMHGFFVPGFPKLSRYEEHFKKVLKKYRPRVYKHLEKQDIPYIYLTKWWFGCFLDRVPFSLALRLWDVFLIEGDPILIAMALNIMKMHERSIKKLTMETFMEFVQMEVANDFGYPDDEVMHSLRDTLSKLKSDRQHVPPPPKPEDLSEVPTKALGPILQKQMSTIREEYHEIQSRRSRANSTGRSPHPKRKESARKPNGPPPVVHKWNGTASQDSIMTNGKEVPFEIPTRRGPASATSSAPTSHPEVQKTSSNNGSVRNGASKHPLPRQYGIDQGRAGVSPRQSAAHQPQRLRDEHNGQMVTLSRASDSDPSSPSDAHLYHHHYQQHSSSSIGARITHAANHVTRIELEDDGHVSVI